MKKIILILSLIILLSGCTIFNPDVENRYDNENDIDEILIENGIIDVVFIEGWGSMDTSSILGQDLWNIPVLDSAEKSTIAVGYDINLNLKFIFIPVKEDREILIYDFPFPDITILEEEVATYNDSLPIQNSCSNEIILESSSDYTLHTSDNFGLIYFDSHNITEYNLMMFIGTTCFNQDYTGVFVIQFSQTEFGIIASDYETDIYYELVIFSLEQ